MEDIDIKILNRNTILKLSEDALNGFLYYATNASLIPERVDSIEYSNKKNRGPYFDFLYGGRIWGKYHAVAYRNGITGLMDLQSAIDLCEANIGRAEKSADEIKYRCDEAKKILTSLRH